MSHRSDFLIVGGGVIGLSLAWRLGLRGKRVCVLDQGPIGRAASWAGAGILPPAPVADAESHPWEQLASRSAALHPEWARQLRLETGIDNGYRQCGGLYLARTAGDEAALRAWRRQSLSEGIATEWLGPEQVAQREPQLNVAPLLGACFAPGEAQVRNPRHLKALAAASANCGAELRPHCEVHEIAVRGGAIQHVRGGDALFQAERYCLTAGPWTQGLLQQLGRDTGILPIRGQMVLFRSPRQLLDHVVNEGPRYLVPRDDGRLLAGSTEEEVGFQIATTEAGLAELTEFARDWVPALRDAEIEATWAGLRPGSFDGFPYLGKIPQLANGFVAAGHFRSGLCLSPATAVVMAQLLLDEPPEIDLAPFRVGR